MYAIDYACRIVYHQLPGRSDLGQASRFNQILAQLSMTLPDHHAAPQLDARQQILRKKMDSHLDALTRSRPTNVQGRYAQMIAASDDWVIREQPVRVLPLSLNQLIKINTRDLGNALIEETRQLNNRYVGSSMRDVEAQLAGDPACIDLQQRILDWSEDVAAQINFKLRHRAKDDPFGTYDYAYRTIVSPLDTELVHGSDRLYMRVWTCVVDMLPYKLWDAFIAAPGHLRIDHDASIRHLPTLVPSKRWVRQFDSNAISEMLGLYGIESIAFLKTIILAPLLEVIAHDPATPETETQRARISHMLADIIEAAPYLISSERSERFMFDLPGSGCVAAFQFTAGSNCAQFVFDDSGDSLRHGLRTAFARGALMMAYDGTLSMYMHPWLTLDRIYGVQQSQMIAYWLLTQVHARIIADFLKIERYFLHAGDRNAQNHEDEDAVLEETLAFVALAKAALVNGDREDDEAPSSQTPSAEHRSVLPQLRQRYFFKLLTHCGVRIEQGKGSEIKLLREGGRPFRLGNHYGSNPTIPSFLASSILKRLEITRDEWLDALAVG